MASINWEGGTLIPRSYHLVAVVAQDDVNEVFSDVMNVPFTVAKMIFPF